MFVMPNPLANPFHHDDHNSSYTLEITNGGFFAREDIKWLYLRCGTWGNKHGAYARLGHVANTTMWSRYWYLNHVTQAMPDEWRSKEQRLRYAMNSDAICIEDT